MQNVELQPEWVGCKQWHVHRRTDEIRRRKPTPLDEMLSGLNYVTALFHQVPAFAQRVDTILEQHGQPRMPLDHAMLRFGSWMGGDRDGNPNVKPSTTRDVVISSRLAACDLYSKLVSVRRPRTAALFASICSSCS